jgi:heme/copper-type cytochrome/quinol oxidase subunit 1
MGMTRRLQHYDVLSWQPWLLVAEAGAVIILAGIICQIVQLVVSIRHRDQLRDTTGDPWNGRTLEWATVSPPPSRNVLQRPVEPAAQSGHSTNWLCGLSANSGHHTAELAQLPVRKRCVQEHIIVIT